MDVDLEEFPPIVVDNGSSTLRAGFAMDDAPICEFSNVIGRRRHEIGYNSQSYVGDEAQNIRELLALTYPVEHGIVVNWDDMEKIWNHMFHSELKVSPTDYPVLFSDPPFNPKGNREKLIQVMFESYQVPAFTLQFEAALCLMSAGRNCGTIVNIGEGYTYVASFWESYTPFDSIKRHDFGGKDLTRYLQHLLHKKGYSFTTSSELEIVREIKEKLCYLTPPRNSQTFLQPPLVREKTFKLPDGTTVTLDQEQHVCPETLFVPDGIFNSSGEGIADMVHNSVMTCDCSTRRDIYCSIMLCGGSTFFPGLADRLHAELVERRERCNHSSGRIRVIGAPDRKYHVWIGGSIQASLSTFKRCWINKNEYEEFGPHILLRKCV
ncbi:hypothetical protein EGW08_001581 [Elysia chlorotica]|uniref:Actin, cytoplasmic n=1 Tax=Elysia chlorotica TaxID=188477 RepID=A0A433UA52_ELYCH|nr:hypothetical protein EGW08_001581 [Elysia chlorotica]